MKSPSKEAVEDRRHREIIAALLTIADVIRGKNPNIDVDTHFRCHRGNLCQSQFLDESFTPEPRISHDDTSAQQKRRLRYVLRDIADMPCVVDPNGDGGYCKQSDHPCATCLARRTIWEEIDASS